MIGQGAGVVSLGNARKAHGELYWAPVMQKSAFCLRLKLYTNPLRIDRHIWRVSDPAALRCRACARCRISCWVEARSNAALIFVAPLVLLTWRKSSIAKS